LASEDSLRFAATSLFSTVSGKKDKLSQCTSSATQLIVRDGDVSKNIEELFTLTLPLKF
jgi:hypothetical protein